MSDLPSGYDGSASEDGPPPQTTPADYPSTIKEWMGNLGSSVQGWGQAAATWVNDFLTRRDIADNATAQAQQFTDNVQQFGAGLDQVIRADPTATDMALGLTALTVP